MCMRILSLYLLACALKLRLDDETVSCFMQYRMSTCTTILTSSFEKSCCALLTGVEDGFKGDSTLFYGSTHEKDNYPGTGVDPSPHVGPKALDPLHRRIVNRTLSKGPQSVPDFRRKW